MSCLFLAFLLVGCEFGCQKKEAAQWVFHGGTIHSLDSINPNPEAVVVAGDSILFTGTWKKAKGWVGRETRVVDLANTVMYPGFIEGHGHFVKLGFKKLNVSLEDVTSFEEMVEKVRQASVGLEPETWIRGRGWHQSKWEDDTTNWVKGFPVHIALSDAVPEHPAYLVHASGHAALLNAKAMEMLGITWGSEFPEGGEIILDEGGNPTGVLVENAMDPVEDAIPEPSHAMRRKAFDLAQAEALSHGITSFQDAGADPKDVALYKNYLKKDLLKVRLYVMLNGNPSEADSRLDSILSKPPEIGLGDNRLTIRSVKLWADGALGSRGAWLLEPYADRHEHLGSPTLPMDYIHRVALMCLKGGYQLAVHAIGDRANREVLDQFEKAFRTVSPDSSPRFRMEHVQHVSDADILRFNALGVLPSFQTIHMASDMPWAIHRLGPERMEEGAYVWQKLLQSGAVLINGTDAPVEPIDPVANFYAAVARKTLKGEQNDWYHPEQALSRRQALESMTTGPAYGAFEENIKGTIAPGKLADFTFLSRDLLSVPEEEILSTRVVGAMIGGVLEYQAEGFP